LRASASEKFVTESTAHNLVELLGSKLVSLDLLDVLLTLADSSLTTQSGLTLADCDILD
jgi:hypothetical protein